MRKLILLMLASSALFGCVADTGVGSSSSTDSSSSSEASSLSSSSIHSSSSSISSSSSSPEFVSACADEVEAGSDAWKSNSCIGCHGVPFKGLTSWTSGGRNIDVYDSDGNGYKALDSSQKMESLVDFIQQWMPAGGTSAEDAQNITAYMTHAIDTNRGWCPGDAWPPAQDARPTNDGIVSSSDSASSEGGVDLVKAKALYNLHCKYCHEDDGNGQHKLNIANVSAAGAAAYIEANMPMGNAGDCVGECAELVAAYILTFEPLTKPELDWDIHKGGDTSQLRRLSRNQLAESMAALTGEAVDVDDLPLDVRQPDTIVRTVGVGFSAQEVSKLMVLIDAYVEQTKGKVLNNTGCNQTGQNQKNCLANWAVQFVERGYNRTLSQNEVTFVRGIANFAGNNANDQQVVSDVLYATFTSPSFLYFVQQGSGNGDVRNLSEREIAERLSLLITNTKPDQALVEAAKAGKLSSVAGRVEQFDRLWKTPATRKAQAEFVFDWVGAPYDKVSQKEDQVIGDLPANFAKDVRKSAERLVSGVLSNGNPTMSNLFTTTNYLDHEVVELIMADKTLGSTQAYPADQCNTTPECKTLFGDTANDCSMSASNASVCMCAGQRCDVTFPPKVVDPKAYGDTAQTSRRGLLMHPYIIAGFTKADGSSPFEIGIKLKHTLLCDKVEEPPQDADEQALKTAPPGSSFIEELRYKTNAGTVCLSCHLTFNDMGFSFMPLDPVGRWLKEDPNLMMEWNDLDGDIPTFGHDKVTFGGPADLSEKFATEPQVLGCFSQAAVELALGRELTPQDKDFAVAINQAANSTDGNIYEIFKAIISSDEFTQVYIAQ